jgi:hypothetical protein
MQSLALHPRVVVVRRLPAAFVFNLYAVIAIYLWLMGDEVVRAANHRAALRAQLSRGLRSHRQWY